MEVANKLAYYETPL